MTVNVQPSIFSELADFLVSQPSLDELANYRFPEPIQRHIENLLEKNREGELSVAERLEMEKMLAMVSLMDLSKAKAKLKLSGKA